MLEGGERGGNAAAGRRETHALVYNVTILRRTLRRCPPSRAKVDETCPISTEGWTRRVHFVRSVPLPRHGCARACWLAEPARTRCVPAAAPAAHFTPSCPPRKSSANSFFVVVERSLAARLQRPSGNFGGRYAAPHSRAGRGSDGAAEHGAVEHGAADLKEDDKHDGDGHHGDRETPLRPSTTVREGSTPLPAP